MAHGYLDDGYGVHGDVGSDRDEQRWRDRDHREHGWRDRADWRDRGDHRGMMFGDGERGREREWGREQGGFGGSDDYREGRRSFSAHPDDHYRSWRDRHMSELDRDYADYCREREQQFHSDFDSWRKQRHASYQPLRTGMTTSGLSHDRSGQVQAATEGTPPESDAMSAATLGTNDEAQTTGRIRR